MIDINSILENERVMTILVAIITVPIGYCAAKFLNTNSNYDKQFCCTKHIRDFKSFEKSQSDFLKNKEFKF